MSKVCLQTYGGQALIDSNLFFLFEKVILLFCHVIEDIIELS